MIQNYFFKNITPQDTLLHLAQTDCFISIKERLNKSFSSWIAISALCLAFLFSGKASGQGATCAGATLLTVDAAPITGLANDTTVNDPTATSCITGTIVQDGWYKFVAAGTTANVIVVSNNRQLVIYAYSGACAGLSQISCANSNGTAGGQTETMNLTGLTNGVTYYVRVGNSGSGTSITINAISVTTPAAPPANDTCAGAISLTSGVSCTPTTGTTVGATDNNETGDCTNGSEKAVWYKFTATAAAHTITVDGASGIDMVIGAITTCGSTTAPTGGACVDATASNGIETLNLTGLTIGVTYYVQAYDYHGVESATAFTICVIETPAPVVNDTCATATSLTPNSSCTPISGSTVGAIDNNETGDCSQGTAEKGIWYKFTATAATATVTVDGAVGQDMVVGAINTCGSATPPTGGSCVDATLSDGIETLNLSGLTIGVTYYIQVYEYDGFESATAFTICVTSTVSATPTITSLGSASGCVGSSITINGTNLSSASAVTIGGTAVASITSNTATQIVAVVASGTTGTVAVTTTGGTATSAATFTVNALPANPGNPTSDSPQCATPGVTLTRAGAPPGGETWYWQTASLGTSTANSGSTYNVTTSGTYYIRAQNNTTGCWSSGQGSLAVTITAIPSALATVPSPANAATGVCYTGTGPVTSVSWTAAALATSYDVYFGTIATPPFVVNQAGTSWTISPVLVASTTYYWKIVPKNACGNTTGSPVTWSFTTSSAPCYCPSSGGTLADGVTGVIFNTISNTGTAVNVAYTDYTAISTSVTKGSSYNLSVYVNTAGNFTNHQTAWIDWNGDADFVDAGETYALGTVVNNANGLSALCPLSIAVPAGAITGSVRMRIQSKWGSVSTSCETGFDGETEDYTINILAPALPTITSLGSASGCAGTSITINGTDFIGITAPNVQIGSTAVTSITSFTATQIIAVIGAGTTGTVAVTTAGGTATSAATFTVNATPIITTQPATPAAVCAGAGSTTLTVAATGATTYQWRRNGINLTNTAPYSNVTTATLTITNPAISENGTTYDVVIGNAVGCTVTSSPARTLSVIIVPATPVTPSPANAATGICYAGGTPVSSISWAASSGATSYDVYFGAGSLPGIVTSNVATNSYTTGVLSANTTYYWKVIAKNACGDSTGTVTWTFTTSSVVCYCIPTGNLSCGSSDSIENVTFNNLNNTTGCGTGGYTVYPATGSFTTTLLKGSSYNFNLTSGSGSGTHGSGVWIDFNHNGSFTDAGEFFLVGNAIAPSTTTIVSIPIPAGAGALIGTTRMRVRYAYNITVASTMSCTMSGTYGETEDYTINLIEPVDCVAPTQPSVLVLSPSGTTISGSFTASSPAADNYLVVVNTTGVAPTPVNTTSYTIGSAVLGGTNIIVDNDSNTAFSLAGLTVSTQYYFYIYSFSSVCTGGPVYNTVSPLNGTTTTTAVSYCAATSTVSTRYINDIQTVGNLTNMTNLNTGRSASGYADYSALPTTTQVPGGGINLDITLAVSRQYLRAWVDWNNDGTFTDSGVELVYTSNGVQSIATSFGFVVPLGTATGNYTLRIRSYEDSQTFTPCGNLVNGETEDYKISVIPDCPALITSVTDNARCESGTVNLTAVGSGSPTEFRWYSALTGGSLIGTSATGSWTTPVIAATTNYYVTAYNGSCESLVRTKVIAKVNLASVINVTPSTPEVCGEGNVVTVVASGDTMIEDLIDEDFQGGLGAFTSVIIGGAGDVDTQWQSKTSTYVPILSVWKPAISSRTIADKFAFTTSDKDLVVNVALESANFSTVPYSDLTLTFRQYYSYYGFPSDYAYVEISTNNGGAWTAVRTYVEDHAIATEFEDVTVDLTPYINNANFKIRFRYNAEFCDGWAIDDVRLFGTKLMNTTFTWGGGTVDAYTDLACTIPYVAQAVTTVYIKPNTAQLAAASWSFTATATLSNGCPVSKLINVYNKTKIWQGGTADWNDANNWSPAGVPTANDCVIVDPRTFTSSISTVGYQAYAKTLTVKNGGILEALSNTNITVTDLVDIKAGGTFNLKNNASLIQINNVTNSVAGTFNMERITQPMYRFDYTYWSSPITLGTFTLGNLSPGSSQFYSWTTSVGGLSGNWQQLGTSSVMDHKKGYIVRAPDTFSSNSAVKVPYTGNFIGTPNNGDVLATISYGTMGPAATDDKWNLIGNPYPSAINADTFVNHASNTPIIDGTIYFWTHNSPPTAAFPDPFYGNFVMNYTAGDYASWNKLGGVGTIASTGGPAPSGYIAAGAAFFVKSLSVSGNATFSNSMRVTNNNNQFFRAVNPTTASADAAGNGTFEKHRIWLNLTNNSGSFSQILVGYAEGATLGMDRDFDGTRFGGNGVTFYSILPAANLGIQGRPLPFDQNDQVTLGYNATLAGTFSIKIDHIDGLFDNQNIYLEDKVLHVIHNLKSAPYVFTTAAGNFNTRFVLRYTENTLGTDTFNLTNTITVTTNEKVTIQSSMLPIKNIEVFDLLGRKIDSYKDVNATQLTLNKLNKTTNVLIVNITLENDVIVTEKIIY